MRGQSKSYSRWHIRAPSGHVFGILISLCKYSKNLKKSQTHLVPGICSSLLRAEVLLTSRSRLGAPLLRPSWRPAYSGPSVGMETGKAQARGWAGVEGRADPTARGLCHQQLRPHAGSWAGAEAGCFSQRGHCCSHLQGLGRTGTRNKRGAPLCQPQAKAQRAGTPHCRKQTQPGEPPHSLPMPGP